MDRPRLAFQPAAGVTSCAGVRPAFTVAPLRPHRSCGMAAVSRPRRCRLPRWSPTASADTQEKSATGGSAKDAAAATNGDAAASSSSSLSAASSSSNGLSTSADGSGVGPPSSDAVASAAVDAEVVSSGSSTDVLRLAAVGGVCSVVAAILQHSWVAEHRDVTMTTIFVLGYAGIILEELLDFHKTGVALLMGVGIWVTLMTASPDQALVVAELSEQVSSISEILFFLIGASTIVEIVDAHQGFKIVTDAIRTNNRRILLWAIGFITFFMSSVLDNLTSTIVMVSLLRKLIDDPKERWLYGAAVVIAANAGGAWTPIGDVTTTMLWIGGQVTAAATIKGLVLPSLVSLIVTLGILSPPLRGDVVRPSSSGSDAIAPRGKLVFWTGLAALLSVPVFKAVTGLPPYLGMLSGLGVVWLVTDVIHAGEEDREELRGSAAVSRIDTSGVLFFLGILLAVAGLESAGILREVAVYLDAHISSREIIAAVIGLVSAVVDNVPLVAATMGMYSLDSVPADSPLWQLIAFAAGTGGSMLIIGSAAGVALMGLEKVDFFWYLKKASLPAFAGFAAGIATYAAMASLHLPVIGATSGM
ncbi:hypothetical protein MMPV_008018 [Pyropia vietnamensis]